MSFLSSTCDGGSEVLSTGPTLLSLKPVLTTLLMSVGADRTMLSAFLNPVFSAHLEGGRNTARAPEGPPCIMLPPLGPQNQHETQSKHLYLPLGFTAKGCELESHLVSESCWICCKQCTSHKMQRTHKIPGMSLSTGLPSNHPCLPQLLPLASGHQRAQRCQTKL